jgi:hypothetical protein
VSSRASRVVARRQQYPFVSRVAAGVCALPLCPPPRAAAAKCRPRHPSWDRDRGGDTARRRRWG